MLRLLPVLILIALTPCAPVFAGGSDLKAARPGAGDPVFTNPAVREIRITMEPAAIEQLRRETREYVKAIVQEGSATYTNVGIHLKGTGSFRPIDQKPAFTVKFNEFVAGQNFYGLTKISLNNAVQDPTYVNEMLCTELFRSVGVPAARVAHARVYLNKRPLGLYTLVEGLNKPFLRRHFASATGNLYEGHTKDINESLDQDNGEETSQADLRALAEAARAPAAERWAKLNQLVDLDRFLSMLSLEVLTAHWDGYWLNRNNYCVYNDPATRKMTFIPHGLDNMFQLPAMPWRPTMQGLLVRAALHTPEGQQRYRERFRQILTNHFRLEPLTNRVNEIAARVRPALAPDGPEAVAAFEKNLRDLQRRIAERVQNVSTQMAALGVPAKFDRSGVALLGGGWSTNVDAGLVTMSQRIEAKKPILTIKHADTGGCIASWRKRVALAGGRYRFRGRVKAEGLLPENAPNVGITLRVSGQRPPFQITRHTDWRWVEWDFEVLPPSDDVDLVCELSTVLGEVSFDMSSLQILKLR